MNRSAGSIGEGWCYGSADREGQVVGTMAAETLREGVQGMDAHMMAIKARFLHPWSAVNLDWTKMLRHVETNFEETKGFETSCLGFSLCSNSADLETCDLWSCDDCSPWHSAGPRRKAVRGTVGQHQMQPCLLWIWYEMVTLGRCIGLLTEGTNAWWGQMLRWLSEQKFIEISCLGFGVIPRKMNNC